MHIYICLLNRNYNVSLIIWQTSIRPSSTHIVLQTIQSLSLTYSWQWITIISSNVPMLGLRIHTIIFYFHPVIDLHANNPFHFHNCCESNVVVLTMMMSLRSEIKSRITILLANAPSIISNQPTKMFTQFTERTFLCHLLKRLIRIVFP